MSDVNSALSVWQLVIIAIVPLTALCGWIVIIFMVAREPRAHAAVAASSAVPAVAAGSAGPAGPAVTAVPATAGDQDQPVEPPARRLAA
jgi:hypothetical protein